MGFILSVLRQARPGYLQISGVRHLYYTTPTAGLQYALEDLLTTERAAYAAIPNQKEQTMIHTMITAISTNLPMPCILLGAITGLLIAASAFL
jgi:hypothetical protein